MNADVMMPAVVIDLRVLILSPRLSWCCFDREKFLDRRSLCFPVRSFNSGELLQTMRCWMTESYPDSVRNVVQSFV